MILDYIVILEVTAGDRCDETLPPPESSETLLFMGLRQFTIIFTKREQCHPCTFFVLELVLNNIMCVS